MEKILVSVTEKYDPIVTVIENTKNLDEIKIIELMRSLEAYERRLSKKIKSQ